MPLSSAVIEQRYRDLVDLASMMCQSHHWRLVPGPSHRASPLTNAMLREHVTGGAAVGLCPIAPGGSTCEVALLDFDSHRGEVPWDEMLRVAKRVCVSLDVDGVNPHPFRSRGGSGVHLLATWDRPQQAKDVRAYLRGVLTSCDLRSGIGGVVRGEVEVFPKQNYVPADGWGSMFVLPWSGKSEEIKL